VELYIAGGRPVNGDGPRLPNCPFRLATFGARHRRPDWMNTLFTLGRLGHLVASYPISIAPISLIRFIELGGYKWLVSLPIFQLYALRAKTVSPCRVVVRILEALGQKRAGILSPENCNPGSGIALPGRDGRLGSLDGPILYCRQASLVYRPVLYTL
jgi:hypothetical protein